MISQANQDAFRQAMRRLAATVTIVATGKAPHRSGLTATAVCSLTANPPQVIACLNASSSTCSSIREAGAFSVNILPSWHQEIAERFSGVGNFVGEQRFQIGDWVEEHPGLPVLADAIASVTCELRHAWEVDTHVILIGAVNSLRLSSEDAPLVYRNGHFGTWTNLAVRAVQNSFVPTPV